MLDMDLMLVIEIQLVQSNEVQGSYHMEKEGFIRSITNIEKQCLKIEKIITNRHLQIQKHVRENITHNNDMWHVAKGFKKKITALSKLKDASPCNLGSRACVIIFTGFQHQHQVVKCN